MQKVELFKPEDFDGAECYSNSANKKLQEYIESCPVAYFKYLGGKPFNLGPELNENDDTHTARLAFIEELPKDKPKVSDKYEYEYLRRLHQLFDNAENKTSEELFRKTGEIIIDEIIKHFKKEGSL